MGSAAHQIPSEAAAHSEMVQGANVGKLHENQGLRNGLALDTERRELLVGVAQGRVPGAVLRQCLVQLLGPQAAVVGQQRLLPCKAADTSSCCAALNRSTVLLLRAICLVSSALSANIETAHEFAVCHSVAELTERRSMWQLAVEQR